MKLGPRFNLVTLLLLLMVQPQVQANAAEEAVNLDTIEAHPPAPAPAHPGNLENMGSSARIMGRVDLSAEYVPGAADLGNHGLTYNHFLMFLKVDASPKVSFMGEMLKQSFYHLTYKP